MSSPARFLSAVNASQFLDTERANHSATWFAVAEKIVDFSAVTTAALVADVLYRKLEPERALTYAPSTVLLCASGFALLFVFLLERHGGYRPCVSLLAIRETERVLRVTLQSFAVALVAIYFSLIHVSRLALSLTLVLVPLCVTIEKWETRHLLRRVVSKRHGSRRAVILGTGNAARRIFTALVRSPKFGMTPVAFVAGSNPDVPSSIFECDYQREHSAPVLSGPICPELFRQLRASVLIIADSSLSRESIQSQMAKASSVGAASYFATGDFLEPGYWLEYAEVDGMMLAHVSRGSNRFFYEFAKRVLDLAVSIIALLLFGPLAAVLALTVKFSSPGPVLFRQERVGRQGRLFAMYKFRSMYVDAPKYGYSPTAGADPRITPIGRLLRRTSLDEIPQLVNVLLGQMSVVGPRPEMPFIVEQYTPSQQQRLAVKPGITGLWQISADRAFRIHENVEYDLYYFRVNIFLVSVPSLRDRTEDIAPLSQVLLHNITRTYSRPELRISDAALAELERYSWPGNIRELRNVLERAAMVAEREVVIPEDLHFQAKLERESLAAGALNGTLKDMERAFINHVLRDEGGSIERTARRLGIPRSSLYNKMRRFEIPQGTGRLSLE